MTFKDPWILLLMPFALIFIFLVLRKQRKTSFRFSSTNLLGGIESNWKVKFDFIPMLLRFTAISFFIMALAGPRSSLQETYSKTEGIDIVLAIDSSGSMAAEDFKIEDKRVNRLAVVKDVVEDFVGERRSDRIGLIAFAALAYTVCPLTTDHDWLSANLKRIKLGLIKDGTAIGSAISSSLARLKDSKAKSKIIILLTDGMNNAGKIDPLTAAKAAKALGIKVYAIGAGAKGYAPFPVKDFFGRSTYQKVLIEIDEKTLKEIAKITGGQYFRATDEDSLRSIYKEIDLLEKTEIKKIGFKEYNQHFGKYLIAALILLVLEVILANTVFARAP